VEENIMQADEIIYFAVDGYGCIRQNTEWDAYKTDKETVFEFFRKVPDEVMDDLGIVLVEKPYHETRLKRPLEEANSIAEKRGLPYRFIMEFWISEDVAVDEFLDAINISPLEIIEEVLRTNHGMADADDEARRKVIKDLAFEIECDDEFHIRMGEYVADYRVGEYEMDQPIGTWGYYHIFIGGNLSKVQKETKDLIMSITEEVLAKVKTKKGKKKKRKDNH